MISTTSYSGSKIIRTETEFIVPMWILDDVGYFYPEIHNHITTKTKSGAHYPIAYIDKFIQLRKQIYWLCNWYNELIDADIPVIESITYCTKNDPKIMEQILEKNLTNEKNKFIRFCNASPKDIVNPIFNNLDKIDNIVNIFQTSNRTNYMFESDHPTHLVVRPVVQIDHEVRCVWHNYKLRAVSGPTYYVDDLVQKHIEHIINNFFQTYGPDIVFNSATIDIGIYADMVFIIEINSFGSDMLARISFFDWGADFMILHNSNKPIYRFKPEFEW